MSVAELRANVAELKQADAEQEMTIALVGQKVDSLEKAFGKHEAGDEKRHSEMTAGVEKVRVELGAKIDSANAFNQKVILSLVGLLGAVVLAVLGLLGANPELIKTAMAATGS